MILGSLKDKMKDIYKKMTDKDYLFSHWTPQQREKYLENSRMGQALKAVKEYPQYFKDVKKPGWLLNYLQNEKDKRNREIEVARDKENANIFKTTSSIPITPQERKSVLQKAISVMNKIVASNPWYKKNFGWNGKNDFSFNSKETQNFINCKTHNVEIGFFFPNLDSYDDDKVYKREYNRTENLMDRFVKSANNAFNTLGYVIDILTDDGNYFILLTDARKTEPKGEYASELKDFNEIRKEVLRK